MSLLSSSTSDAVPVPQRERKAKITPLPLSQMIPMTIVIMNESICGTMLMPFVGYYVAFLRGVPVNEAGYFSGMMVGVFMLGQVVSAKTWGRISDKYGRRFPIISGLFTSGVMMLGFGLSTNVWMCAVFRFFQGLFNGNILVAKTMMADITDKTNQAGGFSFLSLCSAFGFLIGPTLGGLLYDPAHSKGLAWANVHPDSFLGKHPAFLTSLVVFMYTNIGMLVCTFLVKESNPHAQPLPGFVRLIYPCLWYKAKPFVLPPIQYEDEDEEDDEEADGGHLQQRSHTKRGGYGRVDVEDSLEDEQRGAAHVSHSDTPCSDAAENLEGDASGNSGRDLPTRESREGKAELSFPREFVLTASDTTGVSPTFSPVDNSSARARDFVNMPVEMATMRVHAAASALEGVAAMKRDAHGAAAFPAKKFIHDLSDDDGDGDGEGKDNVVSETVVLVEWKRGEIDGGGGGGEVATALSTRAYRGDDDADDDGDRAERGPHNAVPRHTDGTAATEEEVVTKFGYREAFARPYTRFMLSQYMMLCATDIIANNCFPLWAVATVKAGGLGLSTSQVSYILLANSAPCLAANILFRIVERYFDDKMGLFRVGVLGSGTAVLLLPLNAYFHSSAFWVYVLVFLCTALRQIFCAWCYSLNTMLTARSAPPGHVGSIMGINQSCGALVRGIMPFVAAPVFAWSISGDHVIPFNHVMVFFISSFLFYFCWWRSYGIRTDRDGNLQVVQ